MEVERLFINTLTDLAARAEAHDEYEVLMGAALVRKLLLDAHPIVDQVNRKHQLKLVFEIGEPGAFPPGVPVPASWTACCSKPISWELFMPAHQSRTRTGCSLNSTTHLQ